VFFKNANADIRVADVDGQQHRKRSSLILAPGKERALRRCLRVIMPYYSSLPGALQSTGQTLAQRKGSAAHKEVQNIPAFAAGLAVQFGISAVAAAYRDELLVLDIEKLGKVAAG